MLNLLSETEADLLLRRAFPWRATLQWSTMDESFVSVNYKPIQGSERGDTIEVWFERSPGDTFERVTRMDLEAAVDTGVLDMADRIARQPQAEDAELLAEPFRDLVGWQSKSDSRWVARMRLHQSWWRTFRLRVPPGSTRIGGRAYWYGNVLDDRAAAQGRNFLSPQACASYEHRIGITKIGVNARRTERNLLASQPMAFNLFGHLLSDRELLAALLDLLVGDVAEVTSGEIERLSDALGDRTAFDAFITYRHTDGSPRFFAIETKLTEPFSQAAYDWSHYVGHAAFSTDVWTTSDTAVLGDRRWSQLWRNHLLARAEAATHPSLGEPTVLVVHHPDDPHCAGDVNEYRTLLCNDASCIGLDLGRILAALRGLIDANSPHAAWLDAFDDRYLRLNLSHLSTSKACDTSRQCRPE